MPGAIKRGQARWMGRDKAVGVTGVGAAVARGQRPSGAQRRVTSGGSTVVTGWEQVSDGVALSGSTGSVTLTVPLDAQIATGVLSVVVSTDGSADTAWVSLPSMGTDVGMPMRAGGGLTGAGRWPVAVSPGASLTVEVEVPGATTGAVSVGLQYARRS